METRRALPALIILALVLVAILSTGQIPSILPMSPITQSVIFQKNVTVQGSGGNVVRRTTGSIAYTVGAGCDYPTIEAAVATLPDYVDHAIILDIKNGTTITTDPVLSHLNGNGSLSILTDGSDGHQNAIGAGASYIESPFFGSTPDDTYNECWILIVDGAGIDNGFVQITDQIQSTSRATVAAWPGTQPDATSLFIVVGALFSPLNAYDLSITNCSLSIAVGLCGFVSQEESCYNGILAMNSSSVKAIACGFYQTTDAAIYALNMDFISSWTCAFVNCNAGDNPDVGAILADRCSNIEIGGMCYFTSNHVCGARLRRGGYAVIDGNYGEGNGAWGVYATAGVRIDEDLSDEYFTGLSGPVYREDIFGIWQTSNSLADNSVFDTGIAAFFGELIVKDETTGVSAVYRVDGGAAPVLISAHTNFTTTKDTDNKINIYFDVPYKVQNCNAVASIINCAFSGMK
jgi:hypothetical protein